MPALYGSIFQAVHAFGLYVTCKFAARGQPYRDPRSHKLPGGSPIKRAHATACRRAGIVDFHVHDWRHHWASHCVMAGIDLETIRQEGGWKSLRMVERYADRQFGAPHARDGETEVKGRFQREFGHSLGNNRTRIGRMESNQILRRRGKFLDMEGVRGSIPLPPTIDHPKKS